MSERIVLRALTPEARASLAGHEQVVIDRFPFRLGRESRAGEPPRHRDERRRGLVPPNNDYYLLDPGPLLQISREHFQIERTDEGGYLIADRGSHCGLTVGQRRVGIDAPRRCELLDGNTIVVGTPQSRYVFQFAVTSED